MGSVIGRLKICHYQEFEMVIEQRRNMRFANISNSGEHFSLDTENGTFEVFNKRGKHQGEIKFDGTQNKGADPSGKQDINVK